MTLRQPIVSVMGHVDHGKTTLLDTISGSKKAPHEAGGITQSIGAIEVPLKTIEKLCQGIIKPNQFTIPGLLFIDTPGHRAFISMRRRGGSLADIAVLVVAMNEGFMPQTREVLQILRHEKTPFVVAVNKMDALSGFRAFPSHIPLTRGIEMQTADVRKSLDEHLYSLAEQLYSVGFSADRYDRVSDYARNVAMIPVSAKTGAGVPDLLALLVGLAQRFMMSDLESEDTSGEATILERSEERGIGAVANAVLYRGRMKVGDTIVVSGREKPFLSKVRAIHRFTQGRSSKLESVEEITAAAGFFLSATEVENALPGGIIKVTNEKASLDKAMEEIAFETLPTKSVTENGVWLKADTMGSLDALIFECQDSKIPVKGAEVGAVTKKEVTIMGAVKDPLVRAILAFNVPTLPEAEAMAQGAGVEILSDEVIYRLLISYGEWKEKRVHEVDEAHRKEMAHPAKIRFLPGYVFRTTKPAIVGIKVLAGTVRPPCRLISAKGEEIGLLKGLQDNKKSIQDASEGAEVSAAIDGAVVGRTLCEGDIMYVNLNESVVRALLTIPLSPVEKEVLEEVVKIQRARTKNSFWGLPEGR
jgi:translation initiation factor 5B